MAMRKVLASAIILTVALFVTISAHAACDLRFAGPNAKSYAKTQLRKFIDEQVRPRLGMDAGSFNITVSLKCQQGAAAQTVTITIDETDYYLTDIQKHKLSKAESTYRSTPLTMSATNLERQLQRAESINDLALNEIQDLTKMLAFFFAETARFSDVEDRAEQLLAGDCTAQWMDYATLLRRWSRMSRLAIHLKTNEWTARGGSSDQLVAPINHSAIENYNTAIRAGKNGPDEHYVDPRDWGTSISVPPLSCGTQ
jgi:hypothetical protein